MEQRDQLGSQHDTTLPNQEVSMIQHYLEIPQRPFRIFQLSQLFGPGFTSGSHIAFHCHVSLVSFSLK